jgi:hypothetical protein
VYIPLSRLSIQDTVYKDKVESLTVTNARLLFEINQMHKIDIHQTKCAYHTGQGQGQGQGQGCLSLLIELSPGSRSEFLK